ncbi:MAG TPA: 2-oxoglutarate and iron-dependent oxygenase domain-containing protein [Polyangiaceae bacterium]|nr:2-oxoglutarate and iron-dependent oxygenase domain-containing protein [Polyangiaceae bacterium]
MSSRLQGEVPVIDIGAFVSGGSDRRRAAVDLGEACREHGFFYVVGHGVAEELPARLERLSRRFFDLPVDEKLAIAMQKGGRAWRGYFPVGGELTSGRPDLKEGIYFGAELPDDHPHVAAGTPLHGRNLFPDIPGFREAVLDYIDAMTSLGHAILAGVALSLGLPETYFDERYTRDPTILFRIFNYPADQGPPSDEPRWGVGEHTDYGLLTILKQDGSGGLQIKSRARWIDAPPVPGSFICNIGDMLDRMTGGLYRSTPHRARNPAPQDRLSFPFFFDPSWNAQVRLIDTSRAIVDDKEERWDRASVHQLSGTYGDYLWSKVCKVFPDLGRAVT